MLVTSSSALRCNVVWPLWASVPQAARSTLVTCTRSTAPCRPQRPHQRRLRERAAPRSDPTLPPRGEARRGATGKPAGRLLILCGAPVKVLSVILAAGNARRAELLGPDHDRLRAVVVVGVGHCPRWWDRNDGLRHASQGARRNARRTANRARNPAGSYRLSRHLNAVLVLAVGTVVRHSPQSRVTRHSDLFGSPGADGRRRPRS